MNTKWKSSLIDEMLTELATSRQSMAKQTSAISDVVDKSNNILLQIESTRSSSNTNQSHNSNTNNATLKAYTCKKETVHILAKIIENAPQLFSANMQTLAAGLSQNSDQFEQYLEQSHQRAEYLSSCVRKLLAIGDTMVQIKTVVLEESDDENLENECGNLPASA
ncbi:augmin complex subunit msd1 [Eurosta solidaginis]|uniref:augmin complex subunit msd1 n=1 Tax=Eurosta solidaginis TaxID=178769 RepID=UPI003531660D